MWKWYAMVICLAIALGLTAWSCNDVKGRLVNPAVVEDIEFGGTEGEEMSEQANLEPKLQRID